MKWDLPPIIKVYEALGAVADGRLEMEGNAAKVYSSSGNKFYTVTYDPNENAIMVNDNGSYWKGYLGYPAIAFLMQAGVLSYDPTLSALLKGIAWKDINQTYKNNFDKTLAHILKNKSKEEVDQLAEYAKRMIREIEVLDINHLGPKTKPPEGY